MHYMSHPVRVNRKLLLLVFAIRGKAPTTGPPSHDSKNSRCLCVSVVDFCFRLRHASTLRFFPWTSRERPVYFGAPNPNISKGGFTAVKKLFASLLLLTLAVCLSAPSFAQDAAPKKDTATTAKGKAKTDDKMKTDDKATAPKGKAKGHKTDKMDKEKMDKEKTDKGAPKA
jgi:hypothetical protein